MHKNWCGNPCSECQNPCALDESIPCSPDCLFLGKNGETTHQKCQECDALPLFRVPICFDGALYVRALSEGDAREYVCNMRTNKMYAKADGSWAIDDAEAVEE